MKRIAICDDNEIERLIIAEMLKEYCCEIQQEVELTEYSCGEQLIADIEEDECHVELIFLDIYMPGINGMDTAKKLRELHCDTEIVFLTGTTEYAVDGYEVGAVGYLVKPVGMKKLVTLLNHVFWMELKKRVEVKCGKQYRYPFTSDIMYIEGVAHKATFFLVDGSTISTIEKISTLKERIGGESFLQCHQSYLVNMAYIADIQKEVYMTNGKKIPISVRRRTETIERYHQFFNKYFTSGEENNRN